MTADGMLPDAGQFFAYSFGAMDTPAGRAGFPVSFRYGDQGSAALLPDWQGQLVEESTEAGATRYAATLADPGTGLQIRCEVTAYSDIPAAEWPVAERPEVAVAIEWVAYFKNTGTADTPIIADIQALDVVLPVGEEQAPVVHYARGSTAQLSDFAPQESALDPDGDLRFYCYGGRSSDGNLPFFNLAAGERGVIGAIGWTGNWAAEFERKGRQVRIRGGMMQTNLKLHPGEEIRSPRILLLFWRGDLIGGHNLLRRLILAYHTPRPKGQLLQVPICDAVWGERMVQDTLAKARWIKDSGLPVEYFWIDAGWHGNNPFDPKADTFGSAWYIQAGNWYPNKTTYPNGLKEVGDALREMGMGCVLWFEPERVRKGTQWAQEHPEWLLGPMEDNYLFNLGIPEARRFLTDQISALISEGGITCYRQDFNMAPNLYWQAADEPDRVGMTEIRHIEGLYAYWDELLARHPGLIIDNCSSGGRRIDLETISRSVPLWRSDVQVSANFDPVTMQTQTHGLSLWVPLSTGCCREPTAYGFRSALGPGIVLDWSSRAVEMKQDFPDALPLARKLLSDLLAVRPYFYGDFYPLTPFSQARTAWAIWQFDRPDLGEGMLLAIRREGAKDDLLTAKLQGLAPDQQYELRSLDSDAVQRRSGRDLAEAGLPLELPAGGTALFVYKKLA
jgi:alpha-galactosidase